MGIFSAEPPSADDGNGGTQNDKHETKRQEAMRRMGKQARDHRDRVERPESWPNHDKRGRGSR